MNTDFLCEKRLSKLNQQYHTLVKNTAFVLCNALEKYKRFFSDFTDHTILHSMQVLDFCNRLIGENIEKLNEDELYVLIMGAYLHDCGMGISEDDYKKLQETVVSEEYRKNHIHDNIRETVREFHQKFSKQLVYKYAPLFEIPTEQHIYAIATVCDGHRRSDLFDEKCVPQVIKLDNGNEIHLPYLASLIRLADELDIAADRNLGVFGNSADTIFKMMHRSIKKLHLFEDKIVLDVEADDPALYDDIKKEIGKLEKTLQTCVEVTEKRSPFKIKQQKIEINRIKTNKKTVTVLDTDVGTDDAMAFMLLSHLPQKPDYIVTSFGNTTPQGAVQNAILLKKRLGLNTQIVAGLPIPKDENLPIEEKNTFHGIDGLAGCREQMAKDLNVSESEFFDYISFEEFKDKLLDAEAITYITIGSLTNLASLLENSEISKKFTGFYVMGGGIKEFNCANDTEFNFSKHPKAVKTLFSLGVNITLFPLDVTNHQMLTKEQIDRLEKIGTFKEFICFLRHNLQANTKYNGICGAVLHDTLPLMYISYPEYFTLKDMRISVNDVGHIQESVDANAIHVCVDLKDGVLFEQIEKAFKN